MTNHNEFIIMYTFLRNFRSTILHTSLYLISLTIGVICFFLICIFMEKTKLNKTMVCNRITQISSYKWRIVNKTKAKACHVIQQITISITYLLLKPRRLHNFIYIAENVILLKAPLYFLNFTYKSNSILILHLMRKF